MPIASPLVRSQVMDSRDGVLIGQKVFGMVIWSKRNLSDGSWR